MFYRKTIKNICKYIQRVDKNEHISFEQALLNAQNIRELSLRVRDLEEELEELQAKRTRTRKTTKKTKGK